MIQKQPANHEFDLYLGRTETVTGDNLHFRFQGIDDPLKESLQGQIAQILGERSDASDPSPYQGLETAPVDIGLTLPARSTVLEQTIRESVAATVSRYHVGQSARPSAEVGSVCFGYLPGDRIAMRQEEIIWRDSNGMYQGPPNSGPGADWIIAVALDNVPWNVARLRLRNGATAQPPVPENQVLVGLANGTDWPKEIWAANLCSGRLGSVYQEGPNSIPRRLLLDAPSAREGADTIVFRKPGFFGIWHEVGYFPPELFWRAFGGTVIDFTWVTD
jgi:hypothetical protein